MLKHVGESTGKLFREKQMLSEPRGVCKACGSPLFYVECTLPDGSRHSGFVPCKGCEDNANGWETVERNKQLRKERRREIFDQKSLMNPLLKQSSFADFEITDPTQQEAHDLCLYFLQEQLKPESKRNPNFKNVMLYGNVGRGKSHLAAATAITLSEAGKDVIFMTTGQLFRKLKSTFNKQSEHTEDSLMSMLEEAEILFLDDIGAQEATAWKDETMLNLLDARQGKHTFYTTNIYPKEMAEIVGARTWERMLHLTAGQEVKGENKRASFKNWREFLH